MEIDAELEGFESTLKQLNDFIDDEERAIKDAMEFIVREIVNIAKETGNYTDRTGNLRNSISCNIETMQEHPADTDPSVLESKVTANETPVIEAKGNNYKGVVSVGMSYARFVEEKQGYAVIQQAIDAIEPTIDEIFASKIKVSQIRK